jgi:mRNA-degrading endonuclease RelE of RelBE toxin-antitoxin system
LAEQLPEAVATACAEFLYGPLAENPQRVGAPLRAPLDGFWRARRGEYRVRYRIQGQVVFVVDISHRRDAYR